MLGKSSLFLTLSALASLTTADTSACDPLFATTCSPNTALATAISLDFKEESKWFEDMGNPGKIEYNDSGLSLSITKRFDNPSLKSNFYIMYGKFEVIFKAAAGTGIVSSIFLQSDDLDEIDIEWLGGDTTQVQSNYFSKGNTTTYDRGEYHSVTSPQTLFHNYTLDWAEDKTEWYIDGRLVRTLYNTSDQGYPQTPMAVFIGIWAGGDPSNAPGTIEWAGGETDYSDVPFTMYLEKLVVTDYSTGSEYSYNGQSGSVDSIEASDGSVNGRYEIAQKEFADLVDSNNVTSYSSDVLSSSLVTHTSTSKSSSSKIFSSTKQTKSSTTLSQTTEESSLTDTYSSYTESSSTTLSNLTTSQSISNQSTTSLTMLKVSSSSSRSSTASITSKFSENAAVIISSSNISNILYLIAAFLTF